MEDWYSLPFTGFDAYLIVAMERVRGLVMSQSRILDVR